MAARAIWKGQLKIGGTVIPVKVFSAVTDRAVRFHILDDRHLLRVKQHMVDPETGAEVPNQEILKGYEIEPGRFVLLTDEELHKLEPKPSRDIEITEFVPAEQVSQQWYERPYYLVPDGNEQAYFALAAALEKREKVGIVHWVMRNNAYVGVVRPENGHLVLFTLRTASEVISAKDLQAPAGRAPTQQELSMAHQLVMALSGEFNAADYKDEYRDRVMEFIDRKAKGHKPRLGRVKTKRATEKLDSVLKRSLAALKKGKRAA